MRYHNCFLLLSLTMVGKCVVLWMWF